MSNALKQLEICGRIVHLGDFAKAKYTSGTRMKGGEIKGNITQLWSLEHGDNSKQVQLDNGWCFHEGDEILEHVPAHSSEESGQ